MANNPPTTEAMELVAFCPSGPVNDQDLLDARKSERMLALIQKKLKALEQKTITFMEDVKDFPHPTLDSAEQLENYDEQASKIEAELSAFKIDNMGKTIEDNRNYR